MRKTLTMHHPLLKLYEIYILVFVGWFTKSFHLQIRPDSWYNTFGLWAAESIIKGFFVVLGGIVAKIIWRYAAPDKLKAGVQRFVSKFKKKD